jgi:lipopolysaccharide transport system permease protein
MSLIASKAPQYAWVIVYNPVFYIIETARYMLLAGKFVLWGMAYTTTVTLLFFSKGLII